MQRSTGPIGCFFAPLSQSRAVPSGSGSAVAETNKEHRLPSPLQFLPRTRNGRHYGEAPRFSLHEKTAVPSENVD
jgi:hypothetical protein